MAENYTIQDYEAAALGDRLRGVLNIVDMLKGFDLGEVMGLIGKIRDIGNAPDLAAQVKLGIEVLEIVAGMTATETDDKVIGMLKSILTDDVVEIITRIISGLTSNTVQDVTIATADRQAMTAKGVPWSFLVQIALQLLPLIEHFTGDED